MSAFGVVIPAHNEEQVIGRLLRGLLADARTNEVEVVVVCNGCTDRTADVARREAPEARLLEITVASKPAALNAGDAALSVFPRFYIDADVEVDISALRSTASLLRTGDALAAAPRLRMDTSHSPWPVRAYFAIWQQLPFVTDEMVGAGIVGLSASGRSRFQRFPEVIADDMFLHGMFAPGERACARDVYFIAHAPRRLSDLVRRLTRTHAGNQQLREQHIAGGRGSHSPRDLLAAVDGPGAAGALMAYVVITVIAKRRAKTKLSGGRSTVWDRDESSRVTEAVS